MADQLPTPAEQQAEYERRKASHDLALQAWRDGGRQGPPPPHPVRPHTPGGGPVVRPEAGGADAD